MSTTTSECNSAGRVSRCQRDCRRFESGHSLHFFAVIAGLIIQAGFFVAVFRKRRKQSGREFWSWLNKQDKQRRRLGSVPVYSIEQLSADKARPLRVLRTMMTKKGLFVGL